MKSARKTFNIHVYRENCFSKSCHGSACQWQRKAKFLSKTNYCSLSWIPLRGQKLLGLVCFWQVRLRRSTLMATQLSLPVCMTFRCYLKTWSLTEWHWKYVDCKPTSPVQFLTRRRGTTSALASPRAWARPWPWSLQASSFHWVTFFGHRLVPIKSFVHGLSTKFKIIISQSTQQIL